MISLFSQHFIMEKTIQYIEYGLNIFGFNIFKKSNETKFHKARRFIFVLINAIFYIEIIWCFSNSDTNLGDRLFLISLLVGCSSVVVQCLNVWFRHKKFLMLFPWIQKLHYNRRNNYKIMEKYCDGVYSKLGRYFWILMKTMITVYMTDIAAANAAPLLLSDITFLFPMEIPLVNASTRLGYFANYFVQSFCLTTYGMFYGIDCFMFIFFSIHLLQEVKVIHKICRDVGKHEKIKIITEIVKSQKIRKKSDRGQCSKTNTKHDEILIEFEREIARNEGNFKPSSILLKNIKNLHNEAFETLDLIKDIYDTNIFWWEAVMVTSLLIFYIMFLVDRQRIMVYGASALLVSSQYLVISVISAFLKDAFQDIAVALYDSDWYWLKTKDQKTVLKIIMMAQVPKAFGVGVFYEANLERFTDACNAVYNTCLVIKFILQSKAGGSK